MLVEATRNAVQHAYADLPVGDVVLGMTMHRAEAGSGYSDELVVSVRDFGDGCPFEPTSSHPPGLGLSLMSELSENLVIQSHKRGGTEIDATIRLPGDGRVPGLRDAASHGSTFEFRDPAFLDQLRWATTVSS